ncbi:TIGR02678 family protein [Paenactinomyces guangxiensis]|uniref:TIGR02678 family protein n=1 Tax=Paenactinomyces guangxiensis TaxID=1490290 RepID=A0A7W1WP23_9BACL|nr:TIGR02678 family protein [Paenactinomyces guangxiensis]MBA4493432.1 TIGR02678 family protein [Paenactinomyces guangxiensis]MBH8590523.1 TIGR02678 family protein [Paenactinomyces guangxiensis]
MTTNKKWMDEIAEQAIQVLLSRFWIIKEDDPELYAIIRDRESVIKDFMREKCGFRLIVHRYFIKLEKIPAQAEGWMGIREFQEPLDYVLLCSVLAFLENKSVDDQFLLSQLCEELKLLTPESVKLNWENYVHRKSLIRVLKWMQEMKMIRIIDSNDLLFTHDEKEAEALYEQTVLSRYFMRTYPKDLYRFSSRDEILKADLSDDDSIRRRHQVYRRMLLSPVVYESEMSEEEWLYIKNYRYRIAEDLQKTAGLSLEVYKKTALAVVIDQRSKLHQFPDGKMITALFLQFADEVRHRLATEEVDRTDRGWILLTAVQFEQWLQSCKERFDYGWSKEYKKQSLGKTAKELLHFLIDWKMAKVDDERAIIYLLPAIGRMVGNYPADYKEKHRRNQERSR